MGRRYVLAFTRKPFKWFYLCQLSLRLKNTRLVWIRVSLTSWVKGVSLTLVDRTSRDGDTKIAPHGVDVLIHVPVLHSFFSENWIWIIRSIVTDLWKLKLVVALIYADTYPFLTFSDLTCNLESTKIGVFWLDYAVW